MTKLDGQLCEYHLARNGVAVAAIHEVNGEWLCDRCFSGCHIVSVELLGGADLEEERLIGRRYFQRNKQAIYARRKALRAARQSRAAELF